MNMSALSGTDKADVCIVHRKKGAGQIWSALWRRKYLGESGRAGKPKFNFFEDFP